MGFGGCDRCRHPGDCGSGWSQRGRQLDCSAHTLETGCPSCTGPGAAPRRVRMEAWPTRLPGDDTTAPLASAPTTTTAADGRRHRYGDAERPPRRPCGSDDSHGSLAVPRTAVSAPHRVTLLPGSASGPCPCVADSSRPRPFAPAAPPGLAPLCSPPSSLLRPRQTAALRPSSATVASLPDAVPAYDPPGPRAALPGPGVGRACVPEFFDTAEPGDGSPCGAAAGVAFDQMEGLGAPDCPFDAR